MFGSCNKTIRVGLSYATHSPIDYLTMRETLTKLQEIRKSLLKLWGFSSLTFFNNHLVGIVLSHIYLLLYWCHKFLELWLFHHLFQSVTTIAKQSFKVLRNSYAADKVNKWVIICVASQYMHFLTATGCWKNIFCGSMSIEMQQR